MGDDAPAFCVTVLREVAGTCQRLFAYVGAPGDEEQRVLLDHVTQLMAIDRGCTRVAVVLGSTSTEPGLIRLAASLRALQEGSALTQ